MPRGLATALVLVGGLAGLGGVLTFVVITFINGLPALQAQLGDSIDAVATWLATGPLQLSAQQLSGVRDTLVAALNANLAAITTGALSTAGTIGRPVTATLLVLFTLVFFLQGGAQIWLQRWSSSARLSPSSARSSPAASPSSSPWSRTASSPH